MAVSEECLTLRRGYINLEGFLLMNIWISLMLIRQYTARTFSLSRKGGAKILVNLKEGVCKGAVKQVMSYYDHNHRLNTKLFSHAKDGTG